MRSPALTIGPTNARAGVGRSRPGPRKCQIQRTRESIGSGSRTLSRFRALGQAGRRCASTLVRSPTVARRSPTTKTGAPAPPRSKAPPSVRSAGTPATHDRRRLLIIGGAAALIIVLAAVLAVV